MKLTRRSLFASLLGMAVKVPFLDQRPRTNRLLTRDEITRLHLTLLSKDFTSEFRNRGKKIGSALNIRRPVRFES